MIEIKQNKKMRLIEISYAKEFVIHPLIGRAIHIGAIVPIGLVNFGPDGNNTFVFVVDEDYADTLLAAFEAEI